MDFRFTEDQQDLIDAAKAVFDGENTVERMRAMAAGEEVESLWPQFAELGLTGLMAYEDDGGLEQPLEVMSAIAEAAGYAGISENLIESTSIIVLLLGRMGANDDLKTLLAGEKTYGLITTLKPHINFAEACDKFVVVDNKLWPRHEIDLRKLNSIDPLRDIFLSNEELFSLDFVDSIGAVLTAAQLVGLSQRMVDMSVGYAKDRHQFGKPIGSFQAIKHHLANVYTQIEFTRPMVHLAAIQGGRAVHTAKVAAIDTAMLAAETAIQVHGGMGYTFEVDLHLFMKRAWALCGEWGDRNYHMKKLEDMILNGDADIGAGTTFAA